ncbi:MAG: P-loop NTPase fold protein [Rikenellaceae bacterium]
MKSQGNLTPNYPRFINNKPCGADKFNGASQKRLAKLIALHFERNDNEDNNNILPRIIGLEGGWGTGKSNVIKQVENIPNIKSKYHFFEYDAWGHQEDLQRRSILEMLTENLIKARLLNGDWSKKLDRLLARKIKTTTEGYPTLNHGIVAAGLVAIFTPISIFIAYIYNNNNNIRINIAILIALLPLILSLLTWFIACIFSPKYRTLSYLLAIYKNKIKSNINYETISEEETSVRDFNTWMSDVSDSIKGKKLVIVFDNMDRLPAEKVKELWSSIHTFFAEDGFDNIWAITPFDQDHLSCAFGNGEDSKSKELAQYFINKTFPIVYRVAEPVISDYKELFDTLFTEAFGETHNKEEVEIINRIYRLVKPKANIREIIAFINELVALELQRGGEGILLLNMAIFVLHRNVIIADPVKQILSGKYLSRIDRIVYNCDELQEQIAALVYGVEVQHAKQIQLTSYIEECFFGEQNYDINKFVNSDKFDIILTDVIESINVVLLDSAILRLDGLNIEKLDINRINAIWEHLAKQWLKYKEETTGTQSFSDDVKVLLKHTKGNLCQEIIDMQCISIRYPKEFDGARYYQYMNELDEFIVKNNIACTINLDKYTVNTNKFVDYLEAAKDKYKKYKLNTDNNDLDSLFASSLTTQTALKYYEYIPMLRNDGYTFNALLYAIHSMINNNKITENNFESVIFVYKSICDESPLPININVDWIRSTTNYFCERYSNTTDCSSGYYDFIAISLINNIDIPDNRELTISNVANCITRFTTCNNLWKIVIHKNITLLNKTINYMVKKQIGDFFDIFDILPHYEIIKNKTNNSDEELLEYLNMFTKPSDLQKIENNTIDINTLLEIN